MADSKPGETVRSIQAVPVASESTSDMPQLPLLGTMTDEDRNAYVACGKAIRYLTKMEEQGSCGLERDSVYGAAIAVPQIARSTGWSGTMMGFVSRSYMFLLLNLVVQAYLLITIGEEVHVFDKFSGKMHLCDFGASMMDCPNGGKNCVGPDGTMFTPKRLYSFGMWSTRSFVRDSLKDIFPEKADDIHDLADPGEYGLEDYYCRWVCCFIFMMSVMDDLRKSLNLLLLFYYLPSSDEKWIRYEPPEWAEKEEAKAMHGWTELDLVKFRVAGMPFKWKVINFVVVFLPKLVIWVILANSGFYFLMESAGIVEVIMNSMALTFILTLDEMIMQALMSVPVQHMMSNLEDHPLYETSEEEKEQEHDVLSRFEMEHHGTEKWRAFWKVMVPKRLLCILALMAFFIGKYYFINCKQTEDGSWVSKDVNYPSKGTEFRPVEFVFPWLMGIEPDPYWSMPEDQE